MNPPFPRCFVALGQTLCCLAIIAGATGAAHAQLATSFYNITGIQTRQLPNAVQLVIQTDGVVTYGADYAEITESGEDFYRPRALTSLRLRFLRARSQLPAFTALDVYPLDAVSIEPAREALRNPFFTSWQWDGIEPKTDVVLRFVTPVLVRDFETGDRDALPFGNILNPLDVRVSRGGDGQSVIVTVVPDRVAGSVQAEKKVAAGALSDTEELKEADVSSRIVAAPNGDGTFRVEALHAPLIDLLNSVSEAMSTQLERYSLLADSALSPVRVSLHLPRVDAAGFVRALQDGCDLLAAPVGANSWRITAGRPLAPSAAAALERIPLRYLTATKARALLPDFLLPFLRVDVENNSLLVSGSPRLVARLRSDLELLDQPPPLVHIEAAVWEISGTLDENSALQLAAASGTTQTTLDTASGQFSMQVGASRQRQLEATLQALSQRGQGRVLSRSSLRVVSGQSGTLFLGQARYVTVLRNVGGQQNPEALRLAVGAALEVRPLAGAEGNILLDLTSRLSTVDNIESESRLPTLGIREMSSTLRLATGEAALVGGLDLVQESTGRRRTVGRSSRAAGNSSSLLVLIKATLEEATASTLPAGKAAWPP